MQNEIIMVGVVRLSGKGSEHIHLQDYVYSAEGIAPTLTARDYKDGRRILIQDKNYERN